METSETDKQEQQEIEIPKRINRRYRIAILAWSILPPLGWLFGWFTSFLTNYYSIFITGEELEQLTNYEVTTLYGYRMGMLGFAVGWVIMVIITILVIRATHPTLKSSSKVIMIAMMIIISWIPLILFYTFPYFFYKNFLWYL